MLQISEWLPNPVGSDAKGEWVEIWNKGTTSISTAGWVLRNEKGTRFHLSTLTIVPDEYVVFGRPDFTLTLRNTNGGLSLLNSQGEVVSEVSFLGTAPEGKSFGAVGDHFSWMVPTPGLINQVSTSSFIRDIPLHTPLHPAPFPLFSFIFFPILITAFVLYTVKQDEKLSQLLFEGDSPHSEDDALAASFKEGPSATSGQDDDWVED